MELWRHLIICFIFQFCEFIIYPGNAEQTTINSTYANWSDCFKFRQGILKGNITASKIGAKVSLKITSKAVWETDTMVGNCTDSERIPDKNVTMDVKGDTGLIGPERNIGLNGTKGDKGDTGPIGPEGIIGLNGAKGDKGDTGPIGPEGNIGLNGAKGDKGDKGPIGPEGIIGLNGPKGDKGDAGPIGPEGNIGLIGPKGDKGDTGPIGPGGNIGLMGPKGDKGDKGPIGPEGNIGLNGPKGDKGDIGPIGPPGHFGLNGLKGEPGKSCDDLAGPESKGINIGSENKPAYSCKSITNEGEYYINSASKFKVNCQEYESCIILKPFKISLFDKLCQEYTSAFWWSSKINLKGFYNTDFSDLLYLMTTSNGFKLTIKYHCFNSAVETLKMLSWNGNIVENKSSSKTPIRFTIPEETNGCKDAKNMLKSSVIEMETEITSYLPVDFFIGDIMAKTTQKAYIELTSLCFL